jgi:class 3 adenylate cyclase
MRFRDGTVGRKALFAALLAAYALGVTITAAEKLERVGAPDPGWRLAWQQVSPTREDAAETGLRGGGQALAINGIEIAGRSLRNEVPGLARLAPGDTNTLRLVRPGGSPRDVTIPVRRLEWGDVVYAEGATLALGALFFVVGVASFLLRPWQTSSWALLSMCVLFGSVLTSSFLAETSAGQLYYRVGLGLLPAVVLHGALAFPVVHRLLAAGNRVLLPLYALGLIGASLQLSAWLVEWAGPFRYMGVLDTSTLLVVSLLFVGRCAVLSMRAGDALVAQRARILLLGAVFGGTLPVFVRFVQASFGALVVDPRFANWSLAILLLALARISVRHDLMNARVAVRRAVLYGAAVVGLTLLAVALVAVSPYLVALLLLPLLYLWPRFEARLEQQLYPKRSRLGEIVRDLGEEMAACTDAGALLEVLAAAPARVTDARNGTAFLFAEVVGPGEQLRSWPSRELAAGELGEALEKEPLLQLMGTTRREISRAEIAVEPQYVHIERECRDCFDRLDAEVLLPIVLHGRVVGGLAAGPRTTGDVYERVDLETLTNVTQQAVQGIIRIEATERLRSRELEFADLKRFFPPQVIEQVMARGGAAELRTQRKPVTVLFADLRGFTAFSERVEPEEVMATLAEYHEAMGQRINEFAGTLERFVGDGFMVFFNDPVEQDDHVERAARMALAMQSDVTPLRDGWSRLGYGIDVGIGIHTGYATCGFVGYEGRRDYGVIGTVTNLAARLSDAASGGEILVTGSVHSGLSNGFHSESAGALQLSGFQEPQATYRLHLP